MGVNLKDLLKPEYKDIVIQCHDNPDADSIASGYGIYVYLRDHGKNSRLVYSGSLAIRKSNLVKMVDILDIPLEYVRELREPDLLITVDCQYGQKNVTQFPAGEIAVIDHHWISSPETLPRMQDIRSSYGACATVVWKLLTEAGYPVDKNIKLSTALYYGLYMDTGKLQEISHPDDKDMRDDLITDRSYLILLQNANLSQEELNIVGQALGEYDYNDEYHYAVVEVPPCDPNILGLISDMLVEVDVINTTIAFSMLNGKAKLSVRSCIREAQANDLAAYVSAGLGNSGGHLMKAGGTLDGECLKKEYKARYGNREPVEMGRFVHDLLCSRMEQYFSEQEIIDTENYVPDIDGMQLYRKKPEQRGYVEAKRLFPIGTRICLRMLEGEIETEVNEDTYIMTGTDNEVYVNQMKNFDEGYDKLDDPYIFDAGVYHEDGEFQPKYKPIVRNILNGKIRELAAELKSCISKDTAKVYARQLEHRTKVFTERDREKYVLGTAGDWLVVRESNPKDAYIVKKDLFAKNYEPCGQNAS